MYTNFEDRPECPVCEKKLSLHKAEGDKFTFYYWYCECLFDLEYNGMEPDVVHCVEEDD